MANVFISFLGTNDYLSCTYYRDNFEEKDVRFVQEATIKYCCSDWDGDDRIVIFTTREAKIKNWLDNGHIDRNTDKTKQCIGLKNCIDNLSLNSQVQQIDIPDGHDEDEIWKIFKIVYDQLHSSDKVIFDITHAFRSIPMLAIVLLNYAKVLKNVSLAGIYYGAFEVLGTYHQVSKQPLEKRRVPILDLTTFDQLMEWSFAVDRFLEAGDAKAISGLAKKAVAPVLKESKGRHRAAAAVKYVADALDNYTKTLATCRGLEITSSVQKLKKELEKSKDVDLVKPLHPLFEHINKQVGFYKGDIIRDGIQAAKWCLEHNLIQQGFTILQEILITKFIIRTSGDPTDKNQRSIAASAISICQQNIPEDKWTGVAGRFPEITKQYNTLYKKEVNLVEVLDGLTELRNDLNHAGFREQPMKSDVFASKLGQLIDKAENSFGLDLPDKTIPAHKS
ncbi:MAG: hypothetical protein SRB2_03601 [Desulfobacteraceae bacterium Eth-SRB2]|nr:MAG: hypothetical protein SRB2_03601 [Desulfobacteraceae bacterium Eth-SRB2]